MTDRAIIDWPAWTDSPPGRYVLEWEQTQLDRVVSDVFGYHALQLGLPQLDALRENRMPCRGLVLDAASGASAPYSFPRADAHAGNGAGNPTHGATHGPARGAFAPLPSPTGRSAVWCDLLDLPFEAQSVDLIVMPHTLEFTSDPHRLLREAERVLMPEGQLIILGFNSLSLWGARQSVGKMTGRPFVPAAVDLIAFTRLKDWIKLLGFDLERGRFGCYRPPLDSDQWLSRYGFMEAAGDRWWPIFGATYMIKAIKRVRGMRLVGPLKVKKPVLAAGLAPAATPNTRNHTQ
ncbi:class I SAM-dependent methyltransferase [Paraburkholderia sp. SIMBA_055]|jgi:SAM-dependent methyltransferase|uniref:Methyltransferase type 11 n=2 Tax=Paraburkholderia graminis TaxID=60548 RepID=B1G7N3_PARG4|nr:MULTISPECIES: class I SAM-dependent methyltransferase [Paraburkholderia]ALE55466.1 SAM-dependent methyltransferase [Burkholderia sp. HB1]EDT07824.1 Methyltransferase type 11 [Paraburkholderia graminis C4D1M]MDQ0623903.1 SAM-dependent methyltransferase [Paraburkholderia graminis]MDR6203139.1 SAM-dependent methyltransferase [Paraburkholderia graminis]MDR6467607.1 SAM-dependent methyltransferase [Paraburkholderia graminis]